MSAQIGKIIGGMIVTALLAVGGVWFVVDIALRGVESSINVTNQRITQIENNMITKGEFAQFQERMKSEFTVTRELLQKTEFRTDEPSYFTSPKILNVANMHQAGTIGNCRVTLIRPDEKSNLLVIGEGYAFCGVHDSGWAVFKSALESQGVKVENNPEKIRQAILEFQRVQKLAIGGITQETLKELELDADTISYIADNVSDHVRTAHTDGSQPPIN